MNILPKKGATAKLTALNKKSNDLNAVFEGVAAEYDEINVAIEASIGDIEAQIKTLTDAAFDAKVTSARNSKISKKIYSFLND